MPVVCLIDFATCGKSTLKNCIRDIHPEYRFVETDDAARGEYATLRQIYLTLVTEGNTTEANAVIEANERNFLSTYETDGTRTLICIGPSVPAREPEWSDFLQRIHPVCVWLKSNDVVMTCNRLVSRQANDTETSGNDAVQSSAWGSWNNGVSMTYSPEQVRFVPVTNPFQVQVNVAGLMAVNFPRYRNSANETIDVANIAFPSNRHNRLRDRICSYLDGTRIAAPRTN